MVDMANNPSGFDWCRKLQSNQNIIHAIVSFILFSDQ